MGGRGSSGRRTSPAATAERLVANGGKRWQKNGQDRVYLDKALRNEIPEAEFSKMSRSMVGMFSETVSSAYFDVNANELKYKKLRYNDFSENLINEAFNKLKKKKK